jgi:putative SOS response-associated peptidase YedK
MHSHSVEDFRHTHVFLGHAHERNERKTWIVIASWLGDEPDPRDLLITYPSEPMTMWPISTRLNKPENDDATLLERTGDRFDVWAPLEHRREARL